MKRTALALKAFYSGFELPAYSEYEVPDDVDLPYITYSVAVGEIGYPATGQARVWYRGSSPLQAYEKADEIARKIGTGILLDDCVGLRLGTPAMQKQPSEDMIQVVYINLQIDTYHMIGE